MSPDRTEGGQWPGERQPTRWDVHDANESPASTFLERFRAAVLLGDNAEESESNYDPLVDASEDFYSPPITATQYTYPMALLSTVPDLPPQDEIERLHDEFFATFKHHIFMSSVELATSKGALPPYLHLAMASISSAISPASPTDTSTSLFLAAVSMWSVMLETDNREARLYEAVLAAALLVTFGLLSTDGKEYRRSTVLLSQVVTITRRLQLTCNYSLLSASSEISFRELSMKSSLISYMLLIDVLHAIQRGAAPSYSVKELVVKLPSSRYQFRTIYNSITHGHPCPQDVGSQEDGLMLLVALLSDIIYIQRCASTHHPRAREAGSEAEMVFRNPYAPLSSEAETLRLNADMVAALTRWEKRFRDRVDSDVLALYHFARMQLACPRVWELPRLAGYGDLNGVRSNQAPSDPIVISADTIDLAWRILDMCGQDSSPQLSIWLPTLLFMSALAIWQHHRSQASNGQNYGSLRMMAPFRTEVARLPWPCCASMAKTLDELMIS